MGKRNAVILIVGIALLAGIAWWYVGKEGRVVKKSDSAQYPPLELSSNFDPSVNRATFQILLYQKESQMATLQYMYPENMLGEQVISQINCPEGDYALKAGQSAKEQKVTREEFVNDLQAQGGEMVIISGLCGESTCGEIIKECNLYLPGVKAL